MSKSRRAKLLAAVCSVGLMAALASPVAAESLLDALTLAYQTNPTLQEQRANLRALDENVVQAKTGIRPTASLSADVARQQTVFGSLTQTSIFSPTKIRSQEGSSSGATISFTQPLYTGGRVSSAIDAAQADILAGRESLRGVEAGVLFSVIQAYVDVRRDQERLKISQDNVAVLQRQLDESQARFDVGEITRTDVAQAQARLAAAQAGLSSAQAQLAISRASYAAVVGQNPTDLEAEPSLDNLLPTTIEAAFDAAEKYNPQILAADYTEQASRARVAQAKAATRPTVALRGSVGWSDSESGNNPPFDDFDRASSASIVTTIPLFTGGLTSSQIRQQQERSNADRLAIEVARREVLKNVAQAWNGLQGQRALLISNEEQVKAARIAFEGVRQEAQVGLRTTLDVLNAEQELRNAELSLVSARHDEYVAAALLLQAMGSLEARYLTPDVPRYDPTRNAKRVNKAWGGTPWDGLILAADRILAPGIAPAPADAPMATSK
ncbi:outer membrane protein [Caulobacter ginsengisoli]|uniref:Outer membrane protein n=1 Tax=Caulobacter ginsengisoli TaxID=400775 RepID=A0ABU0IPF2_9CAUL|nr:TolC family outer membrane protein [Caulobacter ginsengisoli]MDQ0463882.1 outer membrane protein [Caulobacter ginsengisoli]